ncbi:MAG: preprotein translocase subunit SecE [Proteobacteria bacterium]|nr:preprotein translocase subunit SecE [Pseudomonadota bacterium]
MHTTDNPAAKDTVLLALSGIVLLAGIVAFYWFEDQSLLVRVAMVIGALAVSLGLVWLSWYGRQFWQFALGSRVELRKVVWPDREETTKTTYVVFIFTGIMGVFFWALDWVLTWLTRTMTGQG